MLEYAAHGIGNIYSKTAKKIETFQVFAIEKLALNQSILTH